MNRDIMLEKGFDPTIVWDVIVIGGGATGLGIAIDAASRGCSTLLIEKHDFAKSSSSKSTKLIHGGLRYLKQFDFSLIQEGLKERGTLLKIAPHLVSPLGFIIPHYKFWEKPIFKLGLKIYDYLCRGYHFDQSYWINKEQALLEVPTLNRKNLYGASVYFDAQFDDARFAITLAQTACDLGATLINYAEVKSFEKKDGKIHAVVVEDLESQKSATIKGRSFINATGPFCDFLRKVDDDQSVDVIAPSQGSHIVLPSHFCPSNKAILIPHSKDNRVIFCIPWLGKVLVGTTETEVKKISADPVVLSREVDFLLEEISAYLSLKPKKEDVLSVFAGIRPLVKKKQTKTAKLSRNHEIFISNSNLISVAGGKWTTYRKMAEDVVNIALKNIAKPFIKSNTAKIKLHGAIDPRKTKLSFPQYGKDSSFLDHMIEKDPSLSQYIHPELPYKKVQILWAIQNEMARSIEDILARRTRALFLNAKAAIEAAPIIANMLAKEFSKDKNWEDRQTLNFIAIAQTYLVSGVKND